VEVRDGASSDFILDDETIVVELGGVICFVQCSQVWYVEVQGDYVRLYIVIDSYLVCIFFSIFEECWGVVGFVRIYCSIFVALCYVDEVCLDGGRFSVCFGDDELVVSWWHICELCDWLICVVRLGWL